jgi:hypothetical protein
MGRRYKEALERSRCEFKKLIDLIKNKIKINYFSIKFRVGYSGGKPDFPQLHNLLEAATFPVAHPGIHIVLCAYITH